MEHLSVVWNIYVLPLVYVANRSGAEGALNNELKDKNKVIVEYLLYISINQCGWVCLVKQG